MENKLYFRDFPCYDSASEKCRSRIGKNPYYDLELLSEPRMREEAKAFIEYQSRYLSLETMYKNRRFYNSICKFISEKRKGICSFQEMELDVWVKKFRGWMLKNGLKLTEESHNQSGNTSYGKAKMILYFENLLKYSRKDDTREETEKDIWELDKLGIEIQKNPIVNFKTLNFTKIYQSDIREELKKAVYLHLRSEAVASVLMELTAMRRLSGFLKERYPQIITCEELTREIFEEYLTFLKTEAPSTTHLHTDLNRLRTVLETIGKIYQYSQLDGMILTRDIPPTPKAEFRTYSDAEMRRINACITKQQVQIARIMLIHQMLGTRISDTLTLSTDCLYEKNGETIIRIKQMKTHVFEKPISKELAMLIQAAIDETRKKYGETKYIFVNEKDIARPMQYKTIRYKVVKMIQDEDLRDDNGIQFGFGSHMYRHYYGVKLTEMHLDDWTIAKLLGHSSVRNVQYYRKMSNQLLADETRAVRNMLSEMILENLDGWGEEYEQIRQDDSLK